MVLSMLVAIIAAPGLLGSQEAIRQSQSKEKREEHRARRCNLIATCVKSSQRSLDINGRPIVLKDGKLWIDTGTQDSAPLGHMYAGYYLPYPDQKYEGLVTTVTDAAPIMNWVFIDKDTHEVKYGVRLDAQPNFTGPFDCTRQDRRLTFDTWEGFCAVEETPNLWALYFDVHDDGLRGKVEPGTRVLELELVRKEKRFQKEANARQKDQTTKRKIDPAQQAPVDEALGPEALVERPGVAVEGQRKETTENGNQEADVAELKLEPFKIPRSIFEIPPRVLEGSSFNRPSTPPPAYERTEKVDMTGNQGTAHASPVGILAQPSPLPTEGIRQVSGEATEISNAATQLRKAPPRPEITPSSAVLPQTSSSSPAALQSDTLLRKRTTPTPKLFSGTRALAQAQAFEALGAAQKPGNVNIQSSTNRGSRTSSASGYSRNGQEESRELSSDKRAVPLNSPTPPPLKLTTTKRSIRTAKPSTELLEISQRQRALTDPSDPAVFSAKTQKVASLREPVPRPSQSTTRIAVSRSTSQASPRPPLQRRGTAPLQRSTSNSPTASPHANKASARGSLAATMTIGRGNRGMTARIGGPGERGRPGRSATLQNSETNVTERNTTSALFREIGALVSQDIESIVQ